MAENQIEVDNQVHQPNEIDNDTISQNDDNSRPCTPDNSSYAETRLLRVVEEMKEVIVSMGENVEQRLNTIEIRQNRLENSNSNSLEHTDRQSNHATAMYLFKVVPVTVQ